MTPPIDIAKPNPVITPETIAELRVIANSVNRMLEIERAWRNPRTGRKSGIAVSDDPLAREWQALHAMVESRTRIPLEYLGEMLDEVERLRLTVAGFEYQRGLSDGAIREMRNIIKACRCDSGQKARASAHLVHDEVESLKAERNAAHVKARQEVSAEMAALKAENDALRAGETPRRFTEWSDDDGDVLWFETSLSGGEICEPPVYIGGPSSSDWCYADDDEPFLYWVPLPKIARNKPAPASTEGVKP